MMLRYLLEKEFKQIWRDRFLPKIIFIVPFLQLAILPFAADFEMKRINLAVVDHDRSSESVRLVEKALASGFVDLPVVPEVRVIDMADKVSEVETREVMFPCRVSHLEAPMPFSFLDDAPEEVGDVTLIGCHLSQRIFRSLYDREVSFINVCPADFTEPGVKTIVKCCKVKQGHELDGDVVRVPWGATVPEVVDAINALFSPDSPQRACGRC